MAFAQAIGPRGTLIGIDADARNLRLAEEHLQDAPCSVRLIHGNFRDIAHFDLPPLDIAFADLGLSSPHIDDASRGFTFREASPLDLRFDAETGRTASTWIAEEDVEVLVDALAVYGELPSTKRLAQRMKEARPESTLDVVHVCEEVFGFRAKRYLPQVFQALRIAVNDEIRALQEFLTHIPAMLKPGGRIGVISYHSLEDRLVKQSFRALVTPQIDTLTGAHAMEAPFIALTKRPITATGEELARNPRSRSAKFRAIRKQS